VVQKLELQIEKMFMQLQGGCTHIVAWWVSPTVQLQDTFFITLCGANWSQ